MAIGEKIQIYRKDLGLSQEELGQKLLVSRQTISLWEKGQTVPTIDNLIRLREIFGVSVDDILGFDNTEPNDVILPNETYRFDFTKDELNEIQRLQRKGLYKQLITFVLICIFLSICSIGLSAPEFMFGFALGMLWIGTVSHIKGIRSYNKVWKNNIDRICKSTYEYKFFEDYLSVSIFREKEKIRESKCFFADIEKIKQFDKWLFLQFGGQFFIVRKNELKENSAVFSYMYQNSAKTIENAVPNKWKTLSIVLFVASLLSIFVAEALVAAASSLNGMFIENMWLFFLLTPIPITSIVFGFILKAKGLKYKKNIIAGIIMLFFLCVYGSFVFIF